MSVTRQLVRAALVLLLTALPTLAWAVARVTLEVNTQKLNVDDDLRVTVRASGNFDEITEPELEGWEFRRTSQQQQLSVIGGSMQRTESLMYVATPSKGGKFTIGPVLLLDGSNVVAKSDVVTVEVIAQQAVEQVLPPERATDLNTYAGNAYFVHPTLSTNQPFVGQPFVVSYTLYWSRQRATAGIRAVTDPKYGRLEPESLRDDAMTRAETLVLNGHPYQRQTTNRDLLVASTPGPLRLEGPRFRIEALDARAQKVAAPTIELQVRPIPTAGRPDGFVDGNVGRLRIAATLQTAGSKGAVRGGSLDVQTGERLLLAVTVSGDGNLLGIKPLTLPLIEGMTAEPLTKREEDGVTRGPNGVQGKRTWQWMLSFDRPGHVQIPQIAWTSFDPFQERFDAQTVGPFDLEVRGLALAKAPTENDAQTPGAAPAVHARDGLRPNAVEAKLAATDGRSWTQSRLFRGLLALPWLLVLAIGAAWLKRRRQERAAPERLRRMALPHALAQLRNAATRDPGEGYAQTRQIVADYLRQAGDLEIGGRTEQGAVDDLTRHGVPTDVARALAADLQHCDFARFAPAGDRQTDLTQTTERIGQHLTQIDATLLRSHLPTVSRTAGLLLMLAATALLPHTVHATTLDETFAAANRAYAQHDYAAAKDRYDALLSHDVPAAAIHYNLGNTLVQLGQLGRAVAQYQVALQLHPEAALQTDVLHNLQAVRAELTDRARRHHATVHVFDESASLDVMFAQSAPRGLLGLVALLTGLLAAGLLAKRLLGRTEPQKLVSLQLAITVAAVLHVLSLGALLWANREREALIQAVVVEEDAQLTACQSQGEPDDLGLPEGLEVRRLGETADGRVRVRLPNGREGCLPASALELEAPGGL